MKTSCFTENQIINILNQVEAGTPVPKLCREHGMSSVSFYKWWSKYGGIDASIMTRTQELEDKNRRFNKVYAEEKMKAEIIGSVAIAVAGGAEAH